MINAQEKKHKVKQGNLIEMAMRVVKDGLFKKIVFQPSHEVMRSRDWPRVGNR